MTGTCHCKSRTDNHIDKNNKYHCLFHHYFNIFSHFDFSLAVKRVPSPCWVFPQLPSKSPELPGVEMILQDDSPAVVELQEEEEEEIEVDGKAAHLAIRTKKQYL